ncbi:DUF5005 domain-containing protein [Thermasporomyces composti]|uniref:Uncharacterized protein DUF5005 n=1 Tax=Thermasporomyces composti TaxID=696763 RepID=A0A3D9VFN7_THECX|nr:DUF5005 domain-containing protein [Thermasporomyces composti]REF36964.1 uncharacterized protein DUF5005 [Thermasporomyces composti]
MSTAGALPGRRLTRRGLVSAGLAAGGLAVTGARVASAEGRPPRSTDGPRMPVLRSVRRASWLEDMFTRYGDAADANTWSGGDGTYSAKLPDGRRIWMFSDTFLGPVEPDGSRPDAAFINNSIVVQEDGELRTIHGGTRENPAAVLAPEDPNAWYWVNANNIAGGTLNVIYLEFARTGSGMFDFVWRRTVLARFHLETLEVLSVHELPSSVENLEWNPWLLRVGPYTYIYGVEDLGQKKYMRIARVRGDDLLGRWEFFTGDGWSSVEAESTRVLADVSNSYSVTPINGGYLLITQDTSFPFSNEIVGYFAPTPTGPFGERTVLYRTPETGPDGTYGNPNVIMYGPHEHPQFRRGNTLVVSYDVNSLNPDDVWNDASIYRPRFVELTFAPR